MASLWGPRTAEQSGLAMPLLAANPSGSAARGNGNTLLASETWEAVTAEDLSPDLPPLAALRDSRIAPRRDREEAYTATQVITRLLAKTAGWIVGTFLLLILTVFVFSVIYYGTEMLLDRSVDKLGGKVPEPSPVAP